MNLPYTLTHLERFYTCTHLFRGRNASRSGGEKASAEHQIKVRQSLGAQIFPHQATSGTIRGLPLMCESRKERSDGIAHCYEVNRVECPLPIGLCGCKRGETREEGVAQDLMCSHSPIYTNFHYICRRCQGRLPKSSPRDIAFSVLLQQDKMRPMIYRTFRPKGCISPSLP